MYKVILPKQVNYRDSITDDWCEVNKPLLDSIVKSFDRKFSDTTSYIFKKLIDKFKKFNIKDSDKDYALLTELELSDAILNTYEGKCILNYKIFIIPIRYVGVDTYLNTVRIGLRLIFAHPNHNITQLDLYAYGKLLNIDYESDDDSVEFKLLKVSMLYNKPVISFIEMLKTEGFYQMPEHVHYIQNYDENNIVTDSSDMINNILKKFVQRIPTIGKIS